MSYIHQEKVWPKFVWDHQKISAILGPVCTRQGRLLGRMEALGFALRNEAQLQTLTLEIIKSSAIEGESLDLGQVRSSVARRLGMDVAGLIPSDRYVDGIVEMMVDATQNYNKPLTQERLFDWQASLFPSARSGMRKIIIGAWRRDTAGPMQVVSGPIGREKVHFEAPGDIRLDREMKLFLDWFEHMRDLDPVLKAGIAHLWFVTVHPFEDGNGRIARAITDMQLARADGTKERFYSMSVQIRQERNAYYHILETTQKSRDIMTEGINITLWLEWFLSCLSRSLDATESTLTNVFKKAKFWEVHGTMSIQQRQRDMINKLFDNFEGKLTTSKWAKMVKCSQDTAHRDIIDLVEKGMLVKDVAGGRSTSYLLKNV